MKYFITTLTILLLLSGCSKNNAFDKFQLDKVQELSINSLQSSKIKIGDSVNGIVSAIYLNEVYPEQFNHNEYFFVYVYLKEDAKMYDPNIQNDYGIILKLNNQKPIKIKKLPAENRFTHLVSIKNGWNSYYLIAFDKHDNNDISLVLENGQFFSDPLSYQKE